MKRWSLKILGSAAPTASLPVKFKTFSGGLALIPHNAFLHVEQHVGYRDTVYMTWGSQTIHSRDRYRRSAVWRKLGELIPAFTLGTIKHITHQHFSFVLSVKGDNLQSFLWQMTRRESEVDKLIFAKRMLLCRRLSDVPRSALTLKQRLN